MHLHLQLGRPMAAQFPVTGEEDPPLAQAGGELVGHGLDRRGVQINEQITAQDQIHFRQAPPGVRQALPDQVAGQEPDHVAQRLLEPPLVAMGVEMTPPEGLVTAPEGPGTINPGLGATQGPATDIGPIDIQAPLGTIGQPFVQQDGQGIGLLPGGAGAAPEPQPELTLGPAPRHQLRQPGLAQELHLPGVAHEKGLAGGQDFRQQLQFPGLMRAAGFQAVQEALRVVQTEGLDPGQDMVLNPFPIAVLHLQTTAKDDGIDQVVHGQSPGVGVGPRPGPGPGPGAGAKGAGDSVIHRSRSVAVRGRA